jgi:hypothetical protein
MKHSNARDPKWTAERIKELVTGHEATLRRELLQYVAPRDLDRALDLFLQFRLADYIIELEGGGPRASREVMLDLTVKVCRGEVSLPQFPYVPREIAVALAQAIVEKHFGSNCSRAELRSAL